MTRVALFCTRAINQPVIAVKSTMRATENTVMNSE